MALSLVSRMQKYLSSLRVAWNDTKRLYLVMVVAFLACVVVGLLIGGHLRPEDLNSSDAEQVRREVNAHYWQTRFTLSKVGENLPKLAGHPALSPSMVWSIFTGNVLQAAYVGFLAIFLGIGTLVGLVKVGLMLGHFFTTPIPALLLIINLHGIPEMAMVILCSTVCFELGTSYLFPTAGRSRWQQVKWVAWKAAYLLPLVVVGLLISAVIETYITGATRVLIWGR